MYKGVRNLIMRYPDEEGGAPAVEEKAAKEKSGQKQNESTNTVELAKALKEARENSVPKSEYEKVVAEKNKLVSEIINGGGAGNGQTPAPEQQESIEDLRKDLYGPKCADLSNLEYWKKTLALREAVIKKGDPDPFLPIGTKISPTSDDVAKAENVAKVVQKCIDECNGDSELFTAMLQSKTNNDSPEITMRLAKLGITYK